MLTQQTTGQGILAQGRIVWTSGNLFTGAQQKDDRTKQLQFNQDGSPKIVYGFGLAIPKIDPRTNQWHPEYVKVFQALQAEALTLFPGGNIPQGFAMKFKDGDTDVDPSGTPYNKREGYAGHIVLACTTQLPIKYFRFEGGNNILVNDGFKCGDYVNVQLNIKAHPAVGQGKAGLYVNPSAVQLIQPGKEIINTPSGDQLFGMSAPVYNGSVEAPVAPTMPNMGAPAGMPGQPAMPPMGAPQPGYNAQPAMPPMGAPAQAPAAQPHYGVVPGQFQPQPGQPAMPPMGNAQMPMHGAPAVGGQTQYPQMPTAGQGVPGQQYAQPAYPSNGPVGMPPMPGQMPR